MPDAPLTQPTPPPPTDPLLIEAPRGFALTWMLAGLIVAAIIADTWLGGLRAHAVAWVLAFLIVVGMDYTLARLAQRWHSLVVTEQTISIGADALERRRIVGVSDSVQACHRILGRTLGQGVPRGKKQLRLILDDGSEIIVPTAKPAQLATLLNAVPARQGAQIEIATVKAGDDDPDSGDAEALVELWTRACSLYAVSRLPLPVLDHQVVALAVFTAHEDGELVGYAKLIELDSAPYLAEVAVLPSHMRRGFGTALLEQASEWAAEHGHTSIAATGFVRVPWSVKFLQTCGFSEEPTVVRTEHVGAQLAAYRQAMHAATTGKLREQVPLRRTVAASED